MKKPSICIAAVVLTACATTSPDYQAVSSASGSGYTSAAIEGDRHVVKYTGGKGTDAATVAEFALLRAAELTLESGHEWFAVLQSRSQEVEAGNANDLQGRTGSVLGAGGTGAGAGGGGDRSDAAPGVDDGYVSGGPNIGGFGGGDVPYQVIERWNAPLVNETVMIIQMGSGDEVAFKGLTATPEILSAVRIREEIRAKIERPDG